MYMFHIQKFYDRKTQPYSKKNLFEYDIRTEIKRHSILDSVLIGHILSTNTKLIFKSCMNARPEPDKN